MSVGLSIAVSVCTCGAAVLTLIALGLPEWVDMNYKGTAIKIGLFQVCATVRRYGGQQTICRSLFSSGHATTLPSLLTLCTGCMGWAFVMNLVAAICSVIFTCRTHKSRSLMTSTIVCSVLAGLFGLGAFALWVGKWKAYEGLFAALSTDNDFHLQYMGPAVWLALVMSVWSIINACLAGGVRSTTTPTQFAYTAQAAYPGVVHAGHVQVQVGQYPQTPMAMAPTYQPNNPAIPAKIVESPDYQY